MNIPNRFERIKKVAIFRGLCDHLTERGIMRNICIAAALLISIVQTSVGEIKFLRGPLHEAVARAEADKKPVMIDFITDWCRWCDTLDARTYSDARVADFISSQVVPIKIDAEKGEGIDIARKYAVHAYPTILLITAGGEEIDRIVGYFPAEEFLKSIRDFVGGVNTLGRLKADAANHPDDPSIQYALASKYTGRNDIASAAGSFERILALDPRNTLGHNEEAEFVIAFQASNTQEGTGKLDAFAEKYPSSPMARRALAKAADASVKAGDVEGAKRHFLAYTAKWPDDAGFMNSFAWACAGKKINLDQAAEAAAKAVELAKDDGERAAHLDTQATVEYNRANVDRAISLEEKALDILKNATPKERKGYEETLAKFKSGTK
jgi:thioredoxin-related protein